MMHAVIMAGGAGTRFWPASRRLLPKQLLNLVGQRTLLQDTVARLTGLVAPESMLVLTNRDLVSAVCEQLPDVDGSLVLGEPCKRDTAACIGLAAALIRRRDETGTMVVLPSDQLIQSLDTFQNCLRFACSLVEEDPQRIVTLGIRPTYPAESFGYIERGDILASQASGEGRQHAYQVRMFREKPKADVARGYLESGRFYWNSGIFVWRAATVLDALREFEPAIWGHIQRIADAWGRDEFPATFEHEFAQIQGKSIDYAVMERYRNVAMVEAEFEWDDVGSWGALARVGQSDSEGNVSSGRYLGMNSRNCIIHGDPGHLVVTVGMEDCIVVHTPDATLVARKSDEESVRQIVNLLQQRGWNEYL